MGVSSSAVQFTPNTDGNNTDEYWRQSKYLFDRKGL
jgi:hypothetical protein